MRSSAPGASEAAEDFYPGCSARAPKVRSYTCSSMNISVNQHQIPRSTSTGRCGGSRGTALSPAGALLLASPRLPWDPRRQRGDRGRRVPGTRCSSRGITPGLFLMGGGGGA